MSSNHPTDLSAPHDNSRLAAAPTGEHHTTSHAHANASEDECNDTFLPTLGANGERISGRAGHQAPHPPPPDGADVDGTHPHRHPHHHVCFCDAVHVSSDRQHPDSTATHGASGITRAESLRRQSGSEAYLAGSSSASTGPMTNAGGTQASSRAEASDRRSDGTATAGTQALLADWVRDIAGVPAPDAAAMVSALYAPPTAATGRAHTRTPARAPPVDDAASCLALSPASDDSAGCDDEQVSKAAGLLIEEARRRHEEHPLEAHGNSESFAHDALCALLVRLVRQRRSAESTPPPPPGQQFPATAALEQSGSEQRRLSGASGSALARRRRRLERAQPAQTSSVHGAGTAPSREEDPGDAPAVKPLPKVQAQHAAGGVDLDASLRSVGDDSDDGDDSALTGRTPSLVAGSLAVVDGPGSMPSWSAPEILLTTETCDVSGGHRDPAAAAGPADFASSRRSASLQSAAQSRASAAASDAVAAIGRACGFEMPPAAATAFASFAAASGLALGESAFLRRSVTDPSASLERSSGPGGLVRQTSEVPNSTFRCGHDSTSSDGCSDDGLPPANRRRCRKAFHDEFGETLGNLNQFVVLNALGKGAQGAVFLAVDTDSDELRAIKAVARPARGVRVSVARRKQLEDLAREVSIMKRLRHRNVVALHEVIDDPTHDTMYLVLQYVPHGPLAKMNPDGSVSTTYPPAVLVGYAQQLCAGLQYLHRHGVIHRDIKPENILLGANDQVYLADFGVSEAFDDATSQEAPARRVSGTRGTPAFLAPELLALGLNEATTAVHPSSGGDGSGSDGSAASPRPRVPAGTDGEAVDVWALGITLYALLYGKLPWEFTDARDLFEAIQRRPIELRPAVALARYSTSALPTPTGACPRAALVPCMSEQNRAEPLPRFQWPVAEAAGADTPLVDESGRESFSRHVAGGNSDESHIHSNSGASDAGTKPAPAPAPLALRRMSSGGYLERSSSDGVMRHSSGSHIFGGSATSAATASADEGWRRVLHGMLQRDPKRRSTLRDVRRQLDVLEQRLSQAERMTCSTVDPSAVFTALQHPDASFRPE